MEDSPLVHTLRSLSATEARSFRKFLESPFFNHRDDVLRLFDFILSKKTAEKAAEKSDRAARRPVDWSKEAAFHHVFQSEKTSRDTRQPGFNDGQVRHIMSFLFLLLKNWLAYGDWAADANAVSLATCRAMKRRGLGPVFEKELAASRRALALAAERGTGFQFLEYLFAVEHWEFSKKQNRSGPADPAAVGETFGAFVAATALRHGCASLSRQALQEGEFQFPFLEETLARLERGEFAGSAVVQLYFRGFAALKRPDDEDNFRELSRLLTGSAAALSPSETHEIWTIAINFCIKKLNSGNRAYVREAFELYRAGLERRVILEDGTLAKATFKNVLNLGLNLGETDWCRRFLDEFKPFLPEKDREATRRLGLATLHFRQKNYDRVLELLRESDFRDPLANLDARRMVLRIYFERGEWQALESLLDSFRIYMRRHRADTGYQREGFQNLVRFVRQLMKTEANNSASRQKLREEIMKTKLLAEREWLLGLV